MPVSDFTRLAPIELATGKQAYYMGKPNPLMMRSALKMLGVHSEEAVIIGDRMDTNIVVVVLICMVIFKKKKIL